MSGLRPGDAEPLIVAMARAAASRITLRAGRAPARADDWPPIDADAEAMATAFDALERHERRGRGRCAWNAIPVPGAPNQERCAASCAKACAHDDPCFCAAHDPYPGVRPSDPDAAGRAKRPKPVDDPMWNGGRKYEREQIVGWLRSLGNKEQHPGRLADEIDAQPASPASKWDAEDWRQQGPVCTRCHETLAWEGDLPECEEDALCHYCAWKELHRLRTRAAPSVLRELWPAASAHLDDIEYLVTAREPHMRKHVLRELVKLRKLLDPITKRGE